MAVVSGVHSSSMLSTHETENDSDLTLYLSDSAPTSGSVSVNQFAEAALARLELLLFIDRKCGGLDMTIDAVRAAEPLRAVKAKLAAQASHMADPSASCKTSSISRRAVAGSSSRATGGVGLKRSRASLEATGGRLAGSGKYGSDDIGEEAQRRRQRQVMDKIGHYSLRLAFSQEDREKGDWFIRQESRLLAVRLLQLRESTALHFLSSSSSTSAVVSDHSVSSSNSLGDAPGNGDALAECKAIVDFFNREGIPWPVINVATRPPSEDVEEWRSLRASIQDATPFSAPVHFAVKVPFWQDCLSLLRRRRCFVKDGFAYVPFQEVDEVIIGRFKRLVQESFASLKRRESHLQRTVFGDLRLAGLFKAIGQRQVTSTTLSKGGRGSAYSQQSEERLEPSNLAQLSKRSFPPCMLRCSETLKKTGHLKYNGRLQLWLFFKDCGMTMDEQLVYWKSVWDEPDKFDKQHKYNIRHAYGLEGKRVSYTSYPCSRIIHGLPIPGAGEVHGCPFKAFDRDPLRKLLQSYGAPSGAGLEGCLDLSEANHCELACVEFFKVKHPGTAADNVGVSPIGFFSESCSHHERVSAPDRGMENESTMVPRKQNFER